MRVGIMQPYFLPYIGYWQLINAVDVFVVYDDVNYIKGGWINRNRILQNGGVHYLTIPLEKSSPNKLICDIRINKSCREFNKIHTRIKSAYKKTPNYERITSLVEDILLSDVLSISDLDIRLISAIIEYLNIDTEIIVSSSIKKDNNKKGQNKVIDICKILGADQYINPIGGRGLYNKKEFEAYDIELSFLSTLEQEIIYKQYGETFIPNLSILDAMMFCSSVDIKNNLSKYELI